MRYSNQQKTIALVVGVLAMVFSISLAVWAWTEPGVIPPGGNVSAPINVGSTPQTKTGNLTLPNLYLNATGNEGDVYNADEIIGYGDLILRGKSGNAAPIYLEGTSVIINNDAGTGNVGIGDTTPASLLTVGSGDLFQVDSSGNLIKIRNIIYSWPSVQGVASTCLTNNGSGTLSWGACGGGGGYATIQDEGTSLTQRNTLNFTGAGVTCVDNVGSTRTDCTISGGGISWPLLAPDGSAAAPIYSFSNDPDMGIYRGGVDILRFATAGTDRMTINATGNVGIGTTIPSAKLAVGGTGSVGDAIAAYANSVNSALYAQQSGTGYAGYFSGKVEVAGPATGSGITIRAAGGGDVVLNSGGSLFFDGNYSYASGNYIRPVAANTQAFFTSGAERMRITSGGNVGIGTTNPVAKLQISGNITNNYFRPLYIQMDATLPNVHTAAFVNVAGYGVSIGAYSGDIGMGSVNARKYTNGIGDTIANLILQREGGNVGIGTTEPIAKLAVGGTGSVGDAIAAYSNGECSAIYGEQLGSIGYAGYFSGQVYMSGNVGIGTTSPTNILSLGNAAARKFWIENSDTNVVGMALTVAAGGTITGTSVSNVAGGDLILQAGLGTGTGASTISFQTGTTLTTGMTLQTMSTKMTILGNGNVGIGTTNPVQKLDVNGNIRVRGILGCQTAYTGFDEVTGQPIAGALTTNASGDLICISVVRPSPPACLEEGSLALTPDGFKKMEDLKVGDYVIGYKDGEKMATGITKTSVHDGKWTLYYYKGYWFTGNHKVYTDYEHFEEVSKLSDVTKEYIGKVYDITVEETQNYFGENGLLIHNKQQGLQKRNWCQLYPYFKTFVKTNKKSFKNKKSLLLNF